MITYTPEEIAEDRLDTINRLSAHNEETVEEMREHYVNETGYHEALHTALIIMENTEAYLLDHAAVVFDEEAHLFAHEAHTALFNLYQRLGQLRFAKNDNDIVKEL